METISNRWDLIQEKIQKASKTAIEKLTVIAVSKKKSYEDVVEAANIGLKNFGENYVQEMLPKIDQATSQNLNVHWHFIGELQSNKLNKIAPKVFCIHSIDRASQIEKLEKLRQEGVQIPQLLVQLNIANENTKAGLIERDIQSFFQMIVEKTKLQISGLMTFPPLQEDAEKNRIYFAKMNQWKQQINAWKLDRIDIQDLSMGVSSDFEVALQEGATMIRLGEALFGPRQSL